jgi:hypothetical protein
MVPLTLTAVVVAALLTVVPMENDGSYQCEASPISLFLEPAAENGGEFVFDPAPACNSDARTRVAWTGAIAITGVGPHPRRRRGAPTWAFERVARFRAVIPARWYA